MNQFSAFGIDVVNAELDYRRDRLEVATARRSRRTRRAAR